MSQPSQNPGLPLSPALTFWIAVLLLFLGGGIVWFVSSGSNQSGSGSVTERDSEYTHEAELTSFEFEDQFGKPFSSEDLNGKVWLGSFFFADCPSICVMQNNEIAKVHRQFKEDGLMIVNISVTPDKDPPHKLWQYANRFNADHDQWKFLTGKNIQYVRQVGLDIFALAAADETHTSEVAVFDRSGQRQGSFGINEPKDALELVNLVQKLLDEPAPTEHVTRSQEGTKVAEDRVESTGSQ